MLHKHDMDSGVQPLTFKELKEAAKQRVLTIDKELDDAFLFLGKHPRSVSIFGSARLAPDNTYYAKAHSLSKKITETLHYAVATGGGPGIMEASNKGAFEADGHSLGMNIMLPKEQKTNPYVKEGLNFHYFFTRKVALFFSAEAYIYFPGGFGTMDEFFEIITLIQTHKIPNVPVILVGNDFWKSVDSFIKQTLVDSYKTVNDEDRCIYYITEDEDEIVNIIKNAPLRKE